MTIYIAGPMTGHPLNNVPAFDEAASKLRELGYEVINPADLDRAQGIDPSTAQPSPEELRGIAVRDLIAVAQADALLLLSGWETSKGATTERALAQWLGKPIFEGVPRDTTEPA